MLNGTLIDETCQRLSPNDYVAGRNFNDIPIPDELDAAADTSWGFLTPEALAQDEAEWANLKLKETLNVEREGLREDHLYPEGS